MRLKIPPELKSIEGASDSSIQPDSLIFIIVSGDIEEEVVVELGETDGSRTSILSGLNEGDVVIIKSEIIDKDEVMKNSKDNENAKNQNPPPPNQPKSSGFRNNAGE